MALVRTNLTSSANGATGSTTFTTAAFTPGNNSLLVICMHMGDSGASGNTVSITNTASLSFGSPKLDFTEVSASFHRIVIWMAQVTTGVSMTVTVGTGSTTAELTVQSFYYTGYNTSTPTGVTATGTATTAGATTITLSGAPATTSEVLALDGADTNSGTNDVTAGTGWTQQLIGASGVGNCWTQTQTRTGSASTAVLWNVASGNALAALGAIEIIAAAAGGAAPFVQKDWPLPAAPPRIEQTFSWGQNRKLLIGKDKLPFRQSDWPLPGNPESYPYRSFEWGENRKLLIGQDRLPFRQRDWPLPGNPEPSPYRSFEWDNRKILIGQDQLPFRQRDWPVPIPADSPDARRSWTWSYNLNLIGQDKLPFRQTDWPLPAAPEPDWRRAWTINLLQTTLTPILVIPFRQTDWPLPIGPEPDSRRSWTLGLLQTTLAPGAIPFRQTDWPNPIAAEPDVRRSWATSFNPNLVGQDQLPFRQKDWPLPTPVEADARRGWSSGYNLNLIGQDQFPFRQTDWQLPLPASMWQAAPLIPNLVINQPAPPPGGQAFQYITSLGGVFNPGTQSIG